MYTVYTDGACRNNQEENNFGGWGVVMLDEEDNIIYQDYGSAVNTTNNIMELKAMLEALKMINSNNVPVKVVYSDSAYVVNGTNEWLPNWVERNWVNSKKQPVKNKEYWQMINEELPDFATFTIEKVKGHSGNFGNDLADDLANQGADLAEENFKRIQEKPNILGNRKLNKLSKVLKEKEKEHDKD